MAWNFRSRHQELRRLLEASRRDHNEERFWNDFEESFEQGMKPEDYSLRRLFENFVRDGSGHLCGREVVDTWDQRSLEDRSGVMLYEAGDAVMTSDFSDITGQIIFSKVKQAFAAPGLIGDQLATTVPTEFNGEKIPGISEIGDEAEVIGEGKNYPLVGVGQEFIKTPETEKRGFIVPVTKEAVFFDRTGLVLRRAKDVGTWAALNKEKRILDGCLGITSTYSRNGTDDIATYGDNSGDHDWDNLAASNALSDWQSIETSELLFDGLTDPNTGELISVIPNMLVVPSALKHTARMIVRATNVQRVDNQANASTFRTDSANPIMDYTILSSPQVKSRVGDATTWFLGDFPRAFNYMENWPISHKSAPPDSHEEFHRDIIHQERVSERGVIAVVEPRAVVKNTA